MKLLLPVPDNFSFKRTVISHGWSDLPPFHFDQQTWTLTRVLATADGGAITATTREADGAIEISVPGKPAAAYRARVLRDVRHMFRLDEDMGAFYSVARVEPEFAWIARSGAGRLLRAPSVFEDLVKTICTTNCSWSLTKKMVSELVAAIGGESADGRRAFPTPEAMARQPESFFRDTVRSGYRAPYLKELAERVAAGELDPESWLTNELPTDQLKREMKRVKGVGDYAAENLLKLLGRYEGLALDSWVRAKFARTRNRGREAADAKIEKFYSRFGPWRGLVLWCDMTCDWLDGSEQLAKW